MGQKPCRATSPDGDSCVRPLGHKGNDFTNEDHRDQNGSVFHGGVRTPAHWHRVDNGYMSEADYASWGRLL